MRCPECGAEIKDEDAIYCPRCGHSLADPQAAATDSIDVSDETQTTEFGETGRAPAAGTVA